MTAKRNVEVFTAGCPACDETVQLVRRLACDACDVTVVNMSDAQVTDRARQLGIRSVPAVVVDGQLAECCANRGPSEDVLQRAGVGQAA